MNIRNVSCVWDFSSKKRIFASSIHVCTFLRVKWMKLSAKRTNEMREMMLALTDQEGGVGMNESCDRLGQAVSQRLPCSSFKRQQTSRHILHFFRCFSRMSDTSNKEIIAIVIDFLYWPRSEKAITGILFARCEQLQICMQIQSTDNKFANYRSFLWLL